MADLIVPPKINALLLDSKAGKHTLATLSDFSDWLGSNSGLYFFPEFTDHGLSHLQKVLDAIDNLVTEESRPLLTQNDAVVMVLSTVLHDIAMHLRPDQFLAMIDRFNTSVIDGFGDKPWYLLFDEYIQETYHWDLRRKIKVIGDIDIQSIDTCIKHPNGSDPQTWTEYYKKFLGEFIRRHHGRIAHEIALGLFPIIPGKKEKDLLVDSSDGKKEVKLNVDVDEKLRDLSGLVARSHTLDVRDTFDYIKRYGKSLSPYYVHIVYLMGLLRIADYLDIADDRVNKALYAISGIHNPVSSEEWLKHLSVQYVTVHIDDKQAVHVEVDPESCMTFLSMKKLLKDIQSELDRVWAVFGEVYSYDPTLSKLSINLRRVRSNIDDVNDFFLIYHPKFYPIEAKFNTSGSDLLKLLIGPLYHDSPILAVRELLQNSIDAVRELKFLCDNDGVDFDGITDPDQESDISVRIDEIDEDDSGSVYFTISDKGVGMTPETIANYFLVAGASIRQSQQWQQIFMDGQESKIIYSGRFGIGVFSSFLLGSKIIVSTRSYKSTPEEGVYFEAGLNEDNIELKRKKKEHVGTKISILLKNSVKDLLTKPANANLWDWYVFDNPSVNRYIFEDKLIQRYHYPVKERNLSEHPNWNYLSSCGADVYWNLHHPNPQELPDFVHNGLIVGDEATTHHWSARLVPEYWTYDSMWSSFPAISVIDPVGVFPLNLTKTDYRFPSETFLADLFVSQLKDFLSLILLIAPNKPGYSFSSDYQKKDIVKYISHFGLVDVFRNRYFLHNQKGSILFNKYILAMSSIPYTICLILHDKFPFFQVADFKKLLSVDDLLFAPLGRSYPSYNSLIGDSEEGLSEEIFRNRILLHHLTSEMIQNSELGRMSALDFESRLVCGNWLVDSDIREYSISLDLYHVLSKFLALGLENIDIFNLSFSQSEFPPLHPSIKSVLEKYLSDPFIPYSKIERQKKFKLAYYELKPQIEKWQYLLSR